MRMRPLWPMLPATALLAGVVWLAPDRPAEAKASYESPYGYERTWNAALRLVRVDLGYRLTEKDEANGYLLFEYRTTEASRPSPGSIELVRGATADAPVRVVVQLPQMPRYHEQVLVDALAAKMRAEYGEPPAPRKPPPPPPTPADAGDAS